MKKISFSNLSIKSKIALIVLAVTAFSLIAGFSFVILHDIQTFREDMVESMVAIARVIGDYSVVDLAFKYPEASRRTLSKLISISNVDAVFVYDSSGQLFSSFVRSGAQNKPQVLRKSSIEFSESYLHIYQPIRSQNEFYGTVYLRSSTKLLDSKIRDYVITMVVLLAILILVSAGIAFQLQDVISRPILELAGTARRISEIGDYSIRVPKKSNDEIGELCEGFNNMLVQIERRQKEQDKAELALRESEDRYRSVVESSPDAIFVVREGSVVFINAAGLKMLGYASLQQLKEGTPTEITEKLLVAATTGVPFETTFTRSDEKIVEVEVTITGTFFQEGPAMLVMARDVTESKNLRLAAERMERLAAVGEFAAIVAHEIRNSLGSISLNFKYLSERFDVPEPHRGKFRNIEQGIQRIQEVIKGVLEFSRPASSNRKSVSVQQVLDSSCLTVEKEMEEAGITIIKQYEKDLPDLLIDPNQILQVFVNLFLNARQAMGAGGILRIIAQTDDHDVVIEVEDNGKGISPECLSRIYDPFFTTRADGVGLGLAMVTRTLDQHGAKISVESIVGKGTRFILRFPLATETLTSDMVKSLQD